MELVRPSLDDLKSALRKLGGEATPVVGLPTGWPAVDAILPGGGLPRGRLTEIAGDWSSGKTTFALAAAAAATGRRQLVAWIDGGGELYPPSAAALGVELARLLVVRPTATGQGVARAAEIVAQCRAFALIVADLPPGQRLDERSASRLRAAAHEAQAAIVVLTSRRGSVANASLELAVAARRAGEGRAIAVSTVKGAAPRTAEVLLGRRLCERYLPAEAERELGAIDLALAPRRDPRRSTP